MENVKVYSELESRVRQRTHQLEEANAELESFASSVSHDLRAPLAVIGGSAEILRLMNEAKLDPKSLSLFAHIPAQVQRMSRLIDELLRLSRVWQTELKLDTVDLAALATEIARELIAAEADRQVTFTAQPGPPVAGDAALLCIALENLLAKTDCR